MALKLQVVPVRGEPFDFPIAKDSIVLGRASTSDLVLEDRFLSRHHSRIYRDARGLLIEDLGSRNGTLVNGRQIAGAELLQPGDAIKISGCVISVHDDEAPFAAPEPVSVLGQGTIFKSASNLLQSHVMDSREIENVDALRRFADRLNLLNEVHRALGQSMEQGELLELILERVFDHLGPEQGAIFLRNPSDELELAANRSLPGVGDEPFYSRSLVHEVTEKRVAALVLDVESDERFQGAQSILASGVRSLVAAPLLDDKGSLGMIVLSSRVGIRQFAEEDMELLVSLASVAALRLRNVALLEEAAARQRLEQELALGRRIQTALLPDRLPEVPGYALHAVNIPSRGVSGDYYQVSVRDEGRECALIVVDVSGKGIAASLLTASIEALSAVPIEDGRPPEEICASLSRLLYQRTPPEKYATAFLAMLEPATGRVRYSNAGHNPGLVVRATGEVDQLETTGVPIGILPVASYEAGEITLGEGDLLVLYTDGLTEPEDPDDEEYGIERLAEVCRRHRDIELPELSLAIGRDLERFVRGVPFPDDRTLVLARRRPAGG